MDETLLDGYKTAMLAPALCFYPGSSVDKGMNFGGKNFSRWTSSQGMPCLGGPKMKLERWKLTIHATVNRLSTREAAMKTRKIEKEMPFYFSEF